VGEEGMEREGVGKKIQEPCDKVRKRMYQLKAQSLNLDMTRGKPSSEQLDLSSGLLTCVDKGSHSSSKGIDTRNYGGVDGIDEAKRLFDRHFAICERFELV